DPRFSRLLRSFFMHHSLLHPDGWRLDLNGLLDNLRDELRAAEDIDNVHGLTNIQERSARFFSECAGNGGIHGDNAVSAALQVSRHPMTGPQRTGRESHHSDVSGVPEKPADFI